MLESLASASHSLQRWLKMTERNKKIAGHANRIRRFELFSAYGVGAAFASFLPPLPAFTSTSVADIV